MRGILFEIAQAGIRTESGDCRRYGGGASKSPLGKPVRLLDRFDTCWRWMLDRGDSPWYPSMLIFRQPSLGDCVSVIADVARNLDEFNRTDAVPNAPRMSSHLALAEAVASAL